MVVKTRFAPSPTGFLHVGGVRTALFSWLYAKHHHGQFFLRIEDTDHERSTTESVQAILDGMDWLEITSDEAPVYQSDRYARYHEVAEKLLAENKAYRCVCSKERLEDLREKQLANKEKPRYDGHCRDLNLAVTNEPYVIRFKNPTEGLVAFHDLVYGDIQIDNRELDDLILVRSDGHPTYNFAVVIDDWDMAITHVIRGDDHINNTPKQINIFNALEAPIPTFAHLPMILGDDGKRLSKRHGAVSVLQFKEEGYLPHALLNYLVRLGWSSGDQEIFSLKEMVEKFDLKQVSRGSAGFNYEKLQWLNHHYLKEQPVAEVAAALRTLLNERGVEPDNGPALTALIPVFADRCKTLVEMVDSTQYLFTDELLYDEDAVKKHLPRDVLPVLQKLTEKLEALQAWDTESIHQSIQELSQECSLGMGKVAQPLRVAVTGGTSSPSIDATLVLLGKERTLMRLKVCCSRG
jgi:glutamyl-tRNA synthetase